MASFGPSLTRRPLLTASVLLALLQPSVARERTMWSIDPAHTHISFAVTALGYPRTQGEFRDFDGKIDINFDKPALSSVPLEAQAG